MATLKNRVARLEKEQQFRTWLDFERFLEGLSDEQREEIAIYWRFPEPLPEPLPMGASRLDGLDRNSLMRLWEESERETARIMHEMRGRSPEECRFHFQHEHWPERACSTANCRKRRLEMAMKESPWRRQASFAELDRSPAAASHRFDIVQALESPRHLSFLTV